MLRQIIEFSVRRPRVVVAMSLIMVCYALYRLHSAGLDIFPEFSPKAVIIQTEAPGYSAEQVERLVSLPIENSLAGLIGLSYVRSESIQGLSVVQAVFAERTDLYFNRQLVSERLAALAAQMPDGVQPPVAVPLSSSSATVMTAGVDSDTISSGELRDVVQRVIVPRVLSVPGVADVNVFGGEQTELQVRASPGKMRLHGAGLDEIATAARNATGTVAAGFAESSNQRLGIGFEFTDPVQLVRSAVVRSSGGRSLSIDDVADVGFAAAPAISAAAIGDKPGVIMMIIGQYGANTLTVSRSLVATLEELRPELERNGVTLHSDLFRPANYIEISVRNLLGHLLLGSMFVVLVLWLFLFNIRSAMISTIAIPLSLLAAALVLLLSGVNINVMVLGGLAIALGEVVDDAIIDTENVFRRLGENAAAVIPRPVAQVVLDASMEVRGSVVYASFVIALVFVPLLVLSGVAGRLFAPLGLAYILAILASLLTALTVTPALCMLWLTRGGSGYGSPVLAVLLPIYRRILDFICRRSGMAIPVSIGICVLCVLLLPGFSGRFLPQLREGHYIVHTASLSGTSLQESMRIGGELRRLFLQVPGVRSVTQWAGRAERGADTFGSHYSEYEVDLEPLSGREQQQVLDSLRRIMAEFPGIRNEVNTFLIERVDETISGYAAPVVINLYGEDLDYLDRKASELAQAMRNLPGAASVQVQSPPPSPLLSVRPSPEQMKAYGIAPQTVARQVAMAYGGEVTGQILHEGWLRDVRVSLQTDDSIAELANMPVAVGGQTLPLSHIAEVSQQQGRYNILRRAGRRVQTVTSAYEGENLDAFASTLRNEVLPSLQLRRGVVAEITGAVQEQRQVRTELIAWSLLAGVLVLLLLVMALYHVRHVALLLVNVPFSLLGGALAAWMTGGVLSAGSLVGFVTLFGITVRNAIMLISHYEYLVVHENMPWDIDTVLKGAADRLPSILMTALVTALAMLPIAVDSDNPGREIMGPMAVIIIGGLCSSAVLNLLLLPALMLRYGRPGNARTS